MMSEKSAVLVMILLFALRCILPLALTMLFAWAMNRLVSKWERDEQLQQARPDPIDAAATQVPPARANVSELVRCWVFRDCGCTDCAAYENNEQLCWQIKSEAAGCVPADCRQCAYYARTVAIV